MRARAEEIGLALQFLTRLPVPVGTGFDSAAMGRAMAWFPAVGLAVGGVMAAAFALGGWIWPAPVAAGLAIALGVALTGGLHEDGLADAADGLGGGATRERALEIMRDSRIGSYGMLTLVLVLGLSAAALAQFGPWQGAAGLIAAHTLARYAMLPLMATLPYARAGGAASFTRQSLPLTGKRIAQATALTALGFVALTIGPGAAVTAALTTWGLVAGARRYLAHRLGGYTGDTLGAVGKIAELGVLLAVLAWV
ncbi:cobalamin-5'-phosphate synthase [Rhodovulum imhoffii]|uniref:Adenosylcobinamide-GDP ribazoletransferase n=1 Tax=Rhodovulum imhoffii TaxID=365340 RepID=A0A2T5BVI7_9RHOB|nr:adenosylcobinamide-GDP ribazoletransferase [Rhodovulum imhoffii]MBK5934188.1 adenosylcobinamide-GDP ribazoletransferase [Rhodovulum imhoffii]PTN03565.1 cobalamin-5'-phosphate synthase [Rhodovulum imhoffii]